MLAFMLWLAQGALGPALFGMPVTSAAGGLAHVAGKWFRRMRRSDGLSRIVQAAAADGVGLSGSEFAAVRKLLEDQSTWVQVGRGSVEDLSALIASRLVGRSADSALTAGRAIAAGLLEFAVYDLEPELFGQVLFARLDRLQAGQAHALDQAMLGLHADLAAQFAAKDATNATRFAQVMSQLGQVLDRVAPGPADETIVRTYLTMLIRWLNADPWLQESRRADSVPTPAAIERKLTVAAGSGSEDQDDSQDADELARACTRLVVLGGPGSGKTWLARRTARLCAMRALDELAAGASLDDVELPLYTTCARLLAEPPGEGIRHAIVASALGLLPDLGGSRIFSALRMVFEDRTAPTLLVADSLDEARKADDRIRQADWLPDQWRIVVTTRPASWSGQLAIGADDRRRQVGFLQPLLYPDDVEAFIVAWFGGRPETAEDLMTALRRRPDLRQAASVPIILTFYCLLAADGPLPGSRAELYEKVIRRLLSGRWRGTGDPDLYVDACLDALCGWAWSAAVSESASGVGAWLDEFTSRRVAYSVDERAALDHVAPPSARLDDDSGMTRRRFVHRSVREHLVAVAIAKMPAPTAAEELLSHLWYDPDWEYAAPAALALHPERGAVLRQLIERITDSHQYPPDLSSVDRCWEFRHLLARAAQESQESDWPPDEAAIIGAARADMVRSGPRNLRDDPGLVVTVGWPTSTRAILDELLRQIPETTLPLRDLATKIPDLAANEEDRARARRVLLEALDRGISSQLQDAGEALARLTPTAADRAQGRQALLRAVGSESDSPLVPYLAEAFAQLGPPPTERDQARGILLAAVANGNVWHIQPIQSVFVRLAVTSREQEHSRRALLDLITDQACAAQICYWAAYLLSALRPGVQELERARQSLLTRLATAGDPQSAANMRHAINYLQPTEQDQAVMQRLLPPVEGGRASEYARKLASAAIRFEPIADQGQLEQVLLALFEQRDGGTVGIADKLTFADGLARLNLTAAERMLARHVLLSLLGQLDDAWRATALATAIAGLDPTPKELSRARHVLLTMLETRAARLFSNYDAVPLSGLAGTVAQLSASETDLAKARSVLTSVLARLTMNVTADYTASVLATRISELTPTRDDQDVVRGILLDLLQSPSSLEPGRLIYALDLLGPTAEDRERARHVLLITLAPERDPATARYLARLIAGLEPDPDERARATAVLLASLALLDDDSDPDGAWWIADAVVALDPTAAERDRARRGVLGLLSRETRGSSAVTLAEALQMLEPSITDLNDSDRWPLPLGRTLLTIARRNSTISEWLKALPVLTPPINYQDWTK